MTTPTPNTPNNQTNQNQNNNNNDSNTNTNINANTNTNTNNNAKVNTIISALKSISLDETRDKLIDIFEKKLVDTFTSLVEETKTANSNSNSNNNSNNNPTSLLSAINSILNDSILCESKNSNQCETKSCNVQCSDGVCLLPKRSAPVHIKQTERSLQKEFDSISKSELIKENEKLHRKIDKIQKQVHGLLEKMNKYTKKISDNCRTINELVDDMDSDISSDSDSD
jgi:hypothetical protein